MRRLYRRPDHGWLGGVAAGIAEHLGLPTWVVRVCFVAFAAASGLGVALYAAYRIVLPADPGVARRRRLAWVEPVLSAAVLLTTLGVTVSKLPFQAGGLFVPALLACLGGALIWRQSAEPERDRLRRLSRSSLSAGHAATAGRVRLAAGIVLVLLGGAYALHKANVSGIRDGLVAVIVTVAGIALVTGPWWMRMLSALSEERAERIRSQERADIAAHLHDSVLQTLALIQRNAGSPREVARLARGQERELRTLLYATPTASGQLSEQLRCAAAEVEDSYAISVEVVVVGDAPLDDGLRAVVAASREALVNAAKHSGVTTVSLYAEVEDDAVSVFVKDRGAGFDPDAVADDRQGVRGSILGRIERHGGKARVTSNPGEGTEVEIVMRSTG
jgi:signal transduction histidine kinase